MDSRRRRGLHLPALPRLPALGRSRRCRPRQRCLSILELRRPHAAHHRRRLSTREQLVQLVHGPRHRLQPRFDRGLPDRRIGSWNQDLLFSYDPLNRLSAWANKNGVNCPFNVDRFGNLTDTGGNPSCGMLTGKQANAQNQIAGSVYDASGQPLSDSAGTSYSWNVEGLLSGFQQTGQPAFGYVYDGLGRRVEKLQNGVVTALYLRDAQGELVSELDGTQFTDNILSPGDGARIASVVGSGVDTIYYYHDGPLGTPRAITTAAGANLMSCSQHSGQPNGSMLTYSPFGAEVGGCDQSAEP